EVSGTLSALEIEDLVTVRDVAAVVQRLEMVRRISEEISGYVVELGSDGRLMALQLDELIGGIGADRQLVVRDYIEGPRPTRGREAAQADHAALDANELLDLTHIARLLGLTSVDDSLDGAVGPRGYRLLSKVPRLPASIVDRLVGH